MNRVRGLRAVLFDVFGTVVDWRTSIVAELHAFGDERGIRADWEGFADAWRGRYQPAMEEVRSGRRTWAPLDTLHRESLGALWAERRLPSVPEAELDELNRAWHRLDPWPDVLEGLTRLRRRFTVGTLSNGNTELLRDLADHAGLPWDALLGAETARTYKPLPEAYLTCIAALGCAPREVMLVAAHNADLGAASAAGLRTGFVPRPTESGPGQTRDLLAEGDWDVIADDLVDLAARLGCR